MKMARREWFVLLILFLVFIAPGILAYCFYTNPQWLRAPSTNKGALLNPPLQTTWRGNNKWQLILWNPTACETTCAQQVDKLARIRLALGRRLYEVDQWLVLNENTAILPAINTMWHEQGIRVVRLSQQNKAHLPLLANKPLVLIANPADYLILTYAVPANAEGIFHDIKRLM